MHSVCTNLSKSHAFPYGVRVSSGPICYKPFHILNSQFPDSFSKPPINHRFSSHLKSSSNLFVKFSTKVCRSFPEILVKARNFSNSYSQKVSGGSTGGESLPWLEVKGDRGRKFSEKLSTTRAKLSSWEESTGRLGKFNGRSSPNNSVKKLDNKSSWKESKKPLEKSPSKNTRSAWELSEETLTRTMEDPRKNYIDKDEGDREEEQEEIEATADSRWYKIKNRFNEIGDLKATPPRSEVGRWNQQEDQQENRDRKTWKEERWNQRESWGRKTLKEATESTIPKMVGEGLYGVGPVLAAMSAGRRELYTLYVQEGLELSTNNRKKKDKKGFEKVLKMAEENALTIKKMSKHDLNMVSDNRPHQGLVLDASPLEMVQIKELESVSVDEDAGSVWVALDEVTDPQNLGAIIRSAYFFGVSGIVLCAKNSAPLSGVVSKASAGSLELMELRYCKNMMQFLTSSAENGWRILGGSVSTKAVPLKEVSPGAPTVLVLGSEGTGLRPLVERSCTQLVRIPGNIPTEENEEEVEDAESTETTKPSAEDFRSFLAVESLNVSVAAGVLLHHLVGNYYVSENQVEENFNE